MYAPATNTTTRSAPPLPIVPPTIFDPTSNTFPSTISIHPHSSYPHPDTPISVVASIAATSAGDSSATSVGSMASTTASTAATTSTATTTSTLTITASPNPVSLPFKLVPLPRALPVYASREAFAQQNVDLQALLLECSEQSQRYYAQLKLMESENERLQKRAFRRKKKKRILDTTHAHHMTSDENLDALVRAEWESLMKAVLKEAAPHLKHQAKLIADHYKRLALDEKNTEREEKRRKADEERMKKKAAVEAEKLQKRAEKAALRAEKAKELAERKAQGKGRRAGRSRQNNTQAIAPEEPDLSVTMQPDLAPELPATPRPRLHPRRKQNAKSIRDVPQSPSNQYLVLGEDGAGGEGLEGARDITTPNRDTITGGWVVSTPRQKGRIVLMDEEAAEIKPMMILVPITPDRTGGKAELDEDEGWQVTGIVESRTQSPPKVSKQRTAKRIIQDEACVEILRTPRSRGRTKTVVVTVSRGVVSSPDLHAVDVVGVRRNPRRTNRR
ncbi:hypothetical protein JAAARDRAFT_39758, partial [Jaapia argillacea MUCL 33604]